MGNWCGCTAFVKRFRVTQLYSLDLIDLFRERSSAPGSSSRG
jgi:hypothetical protein